MRPITLRPHEARRLAETGRVVVIRAVEPQLPFDGKLDIVLTHLDKYDTDYGTFDEDREYKCPLGPPGSETWCRETWGYAEPIYCFESGYLDGFSEGDRPNQKDTEYKALFKAEWEDGGESADDRGFSWRSPATMPKWASRFPRVVHVGTRLCRLGGVTEEEAKGAGYDDIFEPGDRPFRDSGGNWAYCPEHGYCFDLIDCWNRDNPRHPAESGPWVWVSTIEKQEPTDDRDYDRAD